MYHAKHPVFYLPFTNLFLNHILTFNSGCFNSTCFFLIFHLSLIRQFGPTLTDKQEEKIELYQKSNLYIKLVKKIILKYKTFDNSLACFLTTFYFFYYLSFFLEIIHQFI